MKITGMLSIGNGEDCPYCKKFVCKPDNDWLTHLQKDHPKEFMTALFGDSNE